MDPFDGSALGGFGSMTKHFDDMARGAPSAGGQYACQSFAMCSRTGPDGKVHTERFANSEVGHRGHRIREAQQAYSNSTSGVDKMALERQLGDQGRKVVRERNRHTMEERSTEMLKGLEESHRESFDRSFQEQARHLPQHPRLQPQSLGFGVGHGRERQMAIGDAAARHRSLPSRHR